jgi:hypothetical protein
MLVSMTAIVLCRKVAHAVSKIYLLGSDCPFANKLLMNWNFTIYLHAQ